MYLGNDRRNEPETQRRFRQRRRIDDRRLGAKEPDGTADRAARILIDDVYAYTFPPVPGIEIGTAYRQAADLARVGGDLIDVYRFNAGSVALSVADISGKGLRAGMRVASVKYALRAYVSAGLTAAQVIRNLNVLYMETAKYDQLDESSFVSVFIALIDPERGVMTYASAGHEPLYLMRNDGGTILLPPTGPLVGVFEDGQMLFHQRLVSLEGASTLVATTDGVTEARSASGRFYQGHGLLETIERNRTSSAPAQAALLMRDVLAFCDDRPHDDIAILVARFS